VALHPEKDWPDDNPAPKRSQCDAIPGACDLNVRRAFDDIKKDENLQGGGFNYFTDGTSNTVAGEILRRAGIKYNFPLCALGSGMPLGINSPTTGGAAHK